MSTTGRITHYEAVELVVEHLRAKGYEIAQVFYPMGGVPVIRVRGRQGAPGFRILFLTGLSGSSGTRFNAENWERTIQSLRDLRAGIRELEARGRYLALGGEPACKVFALTGSAAGRENELAALAGELGLSLMLIDEQRTVISAGLSRPLSSSGADT